MAPRSPRSGAPAGLRRVALLTVFAFGCATVRVPASSIEPTVPVRGGVPDPQLELWLESGKDVSARESEQATAEARAALQAAVARVAIPQPDTLLVVRAQGVARTASRRTDQHAAMAGIVVGVVVIVAAVVVALVASKGKGGGGNVARGGKAVASAPRVRPPPPPVTAPLPRAAPRGGPPVTVQVYAGVEVPPGREPPPPQGYAALAPAESWDGTSLPPPPPAFEQEVSAVALPPPPPLDVGARGFFDGDALRLELVVVDRHTGAPLWAKVVESDVDPRDAQAVERLLYDALADRGGWAPALQTGEPAAMR